MGTVIEVVFDRESKVYFSGETISAKVVVHSEDERKLKLIKGTRVRCKGYSTIDLKWGLKAEEIGDSLSNVVFVDDEARVFPEKLLKSTRQEGSTTYTVFEYPFKFTLGDDLPSSFTTSYGKIEYFFKVSIPSGVAVSYYDGRGPFTVISNLDLNKQPCLRHPVDLQQEANVKTLITEGTVLFHITLPQKGYAIGDSIFLHQELNNNCQQSINANISLIQKISYEFGQMLRLDKQNKLKVIGRTVPARSVDVYNEKVFDVPPLPVTSVIKLKHDQKRVRINYFLKYEIIAKPLWMKKFKGFIPLVIGSVPFTKEISSALPPT